MGTGMYCIHFRREIEMLTLRLGTEEIVAIEVVSGY